MCDDYTDEIVNGESWTADVNSMSDIQLGLGQMTPVNSLMTKLRAYEETAWLYQHMGTDPSPDLATATAYAIWGLSAWGETGCFQAAAKIA
jgi:hypothetical protein